VVTERISRKPLQQPIGRRIVSFRFANDALQLESFVKVDCRRQIGYAQHRSRSHDAVIRVYDDGGSVIETHEHKGDFKGW
jgi:hypothetical protein